MATSPTPIGFRLEPYLYKWLSSVCPMGLARPKVEFNHLFT